MTVLTKCFYKGQTCSRREGGGYSGMPHTEVQPLTFHIGSSSNASPHCGIALHDDPYNGCIGDYMLAAS